MGSPPVYRPRKYKFGKQLLEVRTRILLTQNQLAEQIGVHWRTVQNWETGESYPKAEALQRLIAVCFHLNAFTPGRELEEAAALWRQVAEDSPHTLAFFDEAWFAQILVHPSPPSPLPASTPHPDDAHAPQSPPNPAQPATKRALIDWGETLALPTLVGREPEMASLHQWVIADDCRVVTVLGIGGIGKSSLALVFAQSLLSDFDVVLFRSLQNRPPLTEVLDHAISAIARQNAPHSDPIPDQISDKIAALIQLFREQRCLLILDSLETIMLPGELSGTYHPGYAAYGEFLQALSTRQHQSCLLLTSREKPAELGPFEGRSAPVRTLALTGLTEHACRRVLETRDVFGSPQELQELTRLYGGNPFALNLVAEPIRELFGGDVSAFLASGHTFFDGVTKLMELQCSRTTHDEKSILYWLAIEREVVPLEKIITNMRDLLPQRGVLLAVESLRRRMQIERSTDAPAFTLQPVILEFITAQLVTLLHDEIVTGQPNRLQSHAFVQATAKEYVRRSQEELIAKPLLQRLLATLRDPATVEQRLHALLASWRGQPHSAQDYGPGNVVNLLRLLCGNLKGQDFSNLYLRQIYLQGVVAHDATFANSHLVQSILQEPFAGIGAERVYERMQIGGLTGITEAQRSSLIALGAIQT